MQQSIPLTDVLAMFRLDGESRGFTAATLRFYAGRLGLFQEWCTAHGATMLDELTPALIRQYLAELQQRDLSSAYIHSHARAIKTLCRFCAREELIERSCFDRVKMPRLAKKVLPALTADEVQALLDACSYERDKAMLLFLLDSGVRATELCNLDVADVLPDGSVTIRQGKGQKDRQTFIGARTRKAMLRYFTLERGGKPAASEPLFTALRGSEGKGRLTYFGFAQVLKVLRKRTGVEHCSPHAFRRTFAINSLRSGMDLYTLARLMGHADIQVLRVYLDQLPGDIEIAARQHGVVEHLLKK